MAEGRLTGVSWRERSSEPTSMVSPAGAKTAAKTMTDHAALGPAPSLRIGDARLPVLGHARMYVCGITPYETTHVGHAATFVWADVAARVLRLAGTAVEVCRNVTDIDDHLLMRAEPRWCRLEVARNTGDLPVRARHGPTRSGPPHV